MTKTMTLEKRVLERIKAQGVKPTPKGFFKARDTMLWFLVGVFLAALSIGTSMIIFMVRSADRGVYARLGLSFSQKLLYSIPLFWIAATVVVGIIAYVNFRRTRTGYRLDTRQIVIAAAIVAAAFGSIAYAFNISRYVDKAASENIPLYNAVSPLNTTRWFDPEHGLLSGSVKVKNSNASFTLRDEDFELWTVKAEGAAFLPAAFRFESGDRIKIIGKKTGDFQFQAIEIRPWEMPEARPQKQEANPD
ncbi:MAG TPA: hypothetical protein VFQ72_00565 [Candidatus Paceibacterota bacterium]|nr:hypothetical protein [Candidatus Paceibacterota bacterium]